MDTARQELSTCQQQIADMTEAKNASEKKVQMLQEQSAMSRYAVVCLYTIGEPAACSLVHSAVQISSDIAINVSRDFRMQGLACNLLRFHEQRLTRD